MSYTSPILEQLHTDEFTDVDFGKQADSDLLGWIEPTFAEVHETQRERPRYSGPVYTHDQLVEIIKEKDALEAWPYRRIGHRFGQREGSCVYNALAYAMQIKFTQQFGDELMIPFSPMSGYKFNSRGPNSGSYVGGAIKWAESVGLVPSEDYAPNLERVRSGQFRHVHGETGNYYQSLPDGWKETAKLFRAQEWEWFGDEYEWYSCIASGDIAQGGRDSHSILHCFLALDGNTIYSGYVNSWFAWGMTLNTIYGPLQSFGLDSPRKVRTMVSRDGFRLRTMRRPDFVSHM